MSALTSFRRLGLTAAIGAAAIGVTVLAQPTKAAPIPSQGFTLLDNTSTAATGASGLISGAGVTLKTTVNFSTSSLAALDPLNPLFLEVNLRRLVGSNPLSNLTLEIFSFDTGTKLPTGAALYTTVLGNISAAGNYKFTFNYGFNSFSTYSLALSGTSNSSWAWGTGGSGSNTFTSGTLFSPIPNSLGSPIASSVFDSTSVPNWTANENDTPYIRISTVPGPLPLLGAGSAFAWSRRLRKRVKTSRARPKALDHSMA